MKKSLRISALFVALIAATSLNAQTSSVNQTSPPSDAPTGFTYDFNKAQNLIIERITNPQKSNSDVQALLDHKDFPSINSAKKIDAGYKEELKKWMEKNPYVIIDALKSRKDIVTQY